MFKQLLIFCCIAVSYAARSHLEIRQWLLDKSLECTKDNFISSKEMQMMMNHQLPNTKSSNCFIACVFKQAGWMTDKGVYDQGAVNKFAEEEYAAEPTKLENAKKLFEMCKKVNDETVGDGEAGCDRAKLIAECFLENAPKLDLMKLEETK